MTHDDRKPFSAWLDRHNRYSSLEAEAQLHPAVGTPAGSAGTKQLDPNAPLAQVAWCPLLYFLYIYIVRLGVLDGKAGLRIAVLYASHELSVKVKLEELKAGSCGTHLASELGVERM